MTARKEHEEGFVGSMLSSNFLFENDRVIKVFRSLNLLALNYFFECSRVIRERGLLKQGFPCLSFNYLDA